MKVRLICGNCGRVQSFDGGYEQAFNEDWDTPDRFGYTACDKCPGVAVYFPLHWLQIARDSTDEDMRQQALRKAAEYTRDFDPARRLTKEARASERELLVMRLTALKGLAWAHTVCLEDVLDAIEQVGAKVIG